MDEFSYLSVLLSIIIGLAVTQLLTGMRGQMLGRLETLDVRDLVDRRDTNSPTWFDLYVGNAEIGG